MNLLFLWRFYKSEHVHSLSTAGGDQVHVINTEREAVDLDETEKGEREKDKVN